MGLPAVVRPPTSRRTTSAPAVEAGATAMGYRGERGTSRSRTTGSSGISTRSRWWGRTARSTSCRFPRLRLAHHLRALLDDAPRRPVQHPALRRRRHPQAAVPARHQRPDHPVPRRPRASARSPTSCRSASTRTTTRGSARPTGQDGSRRRCATTSCSSRASTTRAPSTPSSERDGEVDLHVQRRRRHGGAAAHRDPDDGHRRRRGGRDVRARGRRDGGVHLEEAGQGMPSPSAAPDYESRTFKDTVNFWRIVDRALRSTRAGGARR